jgi:glutamine synthetase
LIDFLILPSIFFLLLGYLEDRRPASNMDPYVVTALLAETTILYEPTLEAEALAAQKLSMNV